MEHFCASVVAGMKGFFYRHNFNEFQKVRLRFNGRKGSKMNWKLSKNGNHWKLCKCHSLKILYFEVNLFKIRFFFKFGYFLVIFGSLDLFEMKLEAGDLFYDLGFSLNLWLFYLIGPLLDLGHKCLDVL